MVLPVYKVFHKPRTSKVWQDITAYTKTQSIRYSITLMQSPLTFSVPIIQPLDLSSNDLVISDGDYIAVTSDSTKSRIADDILVGIVDNPGKKMIVYDYDNSNFEYQYSISCREYDFNNNKIQDYSFRNQNLSTILNDILYFAPTQNENNFLGGSNNSLNVPNYVMKISDFTIKSFQSTNNTNREALTNLCKRNGLYWKSIWYCEPHSTNVLNVCMQILIFDNTGLQPKDARWNKSGITDETIRAGTVDNPEYPTDSNREAVVPAEKLPELTTDKDEIVNYVILTANIVDGRALEDDDDGLEIETFKAPSEELFKDTYILKKPAYDIKYVARSVLSKFSAVNSTSSADIETERAILCNPGDRVLVTIRSNSNKYYRTIDTVSGNTITFTEALGETPAVNDTFEVIGNHRLYDENQNDDFDDDSYTVLIGTVVTNDTTPSTTQFSIESNRAALIYTSQIIRVSISGSNEFTEITDITDNLITVSPALSLALSVNDRVDITDLTTIPTAGTEDEEEFSFQDSGGICFKEVQNDQRGRVRFSNLSIPLPTDIVKVHYYPITRRKKHIKSLESIQKYGLRKLEKKLDGTYTQEQFDKLIQELLIPEPNKTVTATGYRAISVGELIPVDIADFVTSNLLVQKVDCSYLGGCYDNKLRTVSEYRFTLSTISDTASEIMRGIERSINVFRPSGNKNITSVEKKEINIIVSSTISKVSVSGTTRLMYSEFTGGKYRIYIANSDGSGAATISDLSYSEYFGAWDFDDQRVFFTSDASGSFEIWSMDIDGGNRSQVTDMTRVVGDCHIVPGATDVIFMYEEGATAFDSRFKAYTISKTATSGTGTAITDNAFYTSTAFPYNRSFPYGELNPVYNPANSNQYAWGGREGSNKYDVVTANTTAGVMNLVYDGQTAGLFGFRPWIDPSGTYIYFLKELSSGGIWEIYRCDNDTSGSNLTGIVTGSDHTYVSISPDNTKILAVRGTAIYSYNLDGSSGTSLVSIGTYFRPQYIEVF